MDDWLEELFKEIIWQALKDFYAGIATWAEGQIEDKLKELSSEVGKEKPLSSSPLVRVLDYTGTANPNVDHITFLVRGRVPLFKGVESVFMRVQVTISTDVNLQGGDPPIQIVEWHTLVGDLKISKANVFEANLGLGYDNGVWMGRGALKVVPAGFGLDLYLGGLSDRGAMIGLSIDLPAPIPLGPTGLGLSGMGGDFAYNFIARLEKNGLPVTDPAAKDYVTWARDTEPLNRWKSGPIDETAVGVGINSDLVTMADNGLLVKLEPIGLAVLTPGPVFVLGGVGKLISTDSARIEGYLAVDIASASMALGLGVKVQVPKPKNGSSFGDKEFFLVDAQGVLDAFFSFSNPSAWYVNLGSPGQMVGAKTFVDILRAELYLMINNNRIAFGAGLSYGGKWSWWVITLTARIGANVAALVGWNPVELQGMLKVWGELGLKIWKFGFALRLAAEVLGHTPKPSKLDLTVSYVLDLPWPIPNVEGKKTLTLGDDAPKAPDVAAPLQAGQALVAGQAVNGPMSIGLLHALTGRQWATGLNGDASWPDAEIVVPFSSRVSDNTGLVVGSAVSATTQGGYEVNHQLDELKLLDISDGGPGTPVAGLQALWAAGPDGDTARLHVLGQDPFSWLVPHVDTSKHAGETPPKTKWQLFGYGPPDSFDVERRFNEMLVDPLGKPAELVTWFQPALPTRVLRHNAFWLRFRTANKQPIAVSQVTLYLLFTRGQDFGFETKGGKVSATEWVTSLYESIQLVAVTIDLAPAGDELFVQSAAEAPLLVYAVRYREARQPSCDWQEKVVLKPGKYQISLSGQSVATYPGGGLPDSQVTTWTVTDSFQVKYPETLRPYIKNTTIGDSRIFDGDKLPWNPTMYGFGFPTYQQYQAVVRFLVPYMDKIFSPLKFRLVYETGEVVEQDLVPAAGSSGDSYTLTKSREWIRLHCGLLSPDQAIGLTDPFPKAGPAAVLLYFDHPNGQEIKLDEWACYISQFDSFADHLAWDQHCLTVLYDAAGRQEQPCCPTLLTPSPANDWLVGWKGNRIDPLIIRKATPSGGKSGPVVRYGPLIDRVYPGIDLKTYPDELTAPPASWRLPAAMSAYLQPLDGATGNRYARFAAETGARFNGGAGDELNGINDTVEQTTVEAVVDGQGRPYALWLRTPEPLDWRRVTATLRIRHVEQTGDCPTGYEKRYPLDLAIEILPSPDGSSSFLVGSLAGQRTRLPRGEYELKLSFNPDQAQLPRLKPKASVGSVPEQVTFKFVQPSGQRWPLPSTKVSVPAGLIEQLVAIYKIEWSLIDLLMDPKPDPKLLQELLDSIQPGPLPPGPPVELPPEGDLGALTLRLDQLNRRLGELLGAQATTGLGPVEGPVADVAGPPPGALPAGPRADEEYPDVEQRGAGEQDAENGGAQ